MDAGPLAPRGKLPNDVSPYRTIGPFDENSLPAGLRAEHSLKQGTWGLLSLLSGAIRFVWDDEQGGVTEVSPGARLVVPPLVPHHVEAHEPFTLTITFHRA